MVGTCDGGRACELPVQYAHLSIHGFDSPGYLPGERAAGVRCTRSSDAVIAENLRAHARYGWTPYTSTARYVDGGNADSNRWKGDRQSPHPGRTEGVDGVT